MKKSVLLVLALVLVVFNSIAQGRIEVKVKNITSQKGSIRVGLFNNEKDFLKNAMEGKVVEVSGSSAVVVFENVPEGFYALSVIHDENNNGELDTNFMGIPREGFAFGNNEMGTFGPPSFQKAGFSLKSTQPVIQEISLRYF